MIRTHTREHAYAAYGLLVLAMAATIAFIAAPAWQARTKFLAQLGSQQFEYRKLTGLIARHDAEKHQSALLLDVDTDVLGYLSGDAPATAAADLQQRLNDIIGTADAALQSTNVVTEARDTGEGKAQKVLVNVQMQSSVEGLMAVIYQIEASPTALFIEQLQIQSRAHRNRRLRAATELLEVRFGVYGYLDPAVPL